MRLVSFGYSTVVSCSLCEQRCAELRCSSAAMCSAWELPPCPCVEYKQTTTGPHATLGYARCCNVALYCSGQVLSASTRCPVNLMPGSFSQHSQVWAGQDRLLLGRVSQSVLNGAQRCRSDWWRHVGCAGLCRLGSRMPPLVPSGLSLAAWSGPF